MQVRLRCFKVSRHSPPQNDCMRTAASLACPAEHLTSCHHACPSVRVQPQPDQPLASCNQFERVWSFDPADWLVRAVVNLLSCVRCAAKQAAHRCTALHLAASV